MVILLVLIPAVIFIAIILLVARHNQKAAAAPDKSKGLINLRLRYMIAPAALFLVSVILAAAFYFSLSTNIAWHFSINGTPDRWLGKTGFITVILVIQLVLLLAGLIVIILTSRSLNAAHSPELPVRKESMLTFMGNVPAIIQIIVGFIMIDDFSYNLSQKHLLPLWLFLIIVLVLATIALIVFFIVVSMKMNRQQDVKEIKDQKSNIKDTDEKGK